ncbi:MAG: Na/Pi cotransporter family protein [Proteobacteria bacterium]|nr:Na/Pi cotransporter family protein [Pseudomonadota bacterium]MBU1641467.1 Na/Pi cotransporter family protein [Pseudomonadota bacterium]
MEFFLMGAHILGGLALFMFSIGQLSNTLKKIASVRLKTLLQKATSNPVKGALIGTLVTFLVQSSSVTVLLLLGFVNAGIMNLRQAIFVMLGSEIGTTITAQIVAFKVKMIFYPLMTLGFALSVLSSKEKIKNGGDILFSLAMIFLAMKIMADGSRPLKEFPFFLELVASLGIYPLFGIAIGALFTAITSSSSATTSMVIAMSMEGVIDLPSGIALIIGANIGTCVLELIAAVGTNLAARRTGMAQFMINILGALLFYPFLKPFAALISLTATEVPRLIANAHTVFNITVSLVLMPAVGLLIFLLKKIVPGTDETQSGAYGILDEKFLQAPAVALYEAQEEVNRMAAIVEEMLLYARRAFFDNDKEAMKTLSDNERLVDAINGKLGSYLAKISSLMLTEKDADKKRFLSHAITDIERVADLAENIGEYASQKNVVFSEPAKLELKKAFDNAALVYSMAAKSLRRMRRSLALDISQIGKEFDELEGLYRKKYLVRQENDTSRPVIDALYPDVLKDLERITDHANNIAEHVMQIT